MLDVVTTRQAELTDRLAQTNELIARVQETVDIVTDPRRQVEAEHELERLQEKRRSIVADLTALPGVRLGEALLRLDYADQMKRFRDVKRDEVAFAFHVGPAPTVADVAADASLLLLKRLLRALPGNGDAAPLRMGFSSPVRRSTVSAMWRAMATWLGLPRDAQPAQVTEGVTARLQHHNVVVILSDLDRVDVDACVSDFWRVMADAAAAAQPLAHQLVLLLVDLTLTAPPPDGAAAAGYHLRALRVEPFPRDVVAGWFESNIDSMPDALAKRQFEELAKEVVDANEGRPDDVLRGIYELWCPEWEFYEWLKT